MSPDDQQRRIEAATRAISDPRHRGASWQTLATLALGAANAAVPVVPRAEVARHRLRLETEVRQLEGRAELAEGAARDSLEALTDFLNGKYEHNGAYQLLRDALGRHPAFLPSEETG